MKTTLFIFNFLIVLTTIQSKIHSFESIPTTCIAWRAAGEKIVFTNGCFDLLHYGHLHYLAEAKNLGDRLVVGLNADASIKRLKGKHRPIKDERSRTWLLAGLECIDAVVVFSEDTPYELIQAIQPDVLVKGGDWAVDAIVGADIVLAKGGSVRNLSFIEGYSTTQLEAKIRKQGQK